MDDRARGPEIEGSSDGAAPAGAAAKLLAAIRGWQRQQPAPLVVAVDGRGAVGKTTLVTAVVAVLPATVIHTDDFFLVPEAPAGGAAGPATGGRGVERGSRAAGAAAGAGAHPQIADYYDLARLRREALEPLSAGRSARFRAHDQSRPGSPVREVTLAPAPLILLEGVGACADPLSDLVHRRVLVRVADEERLTRLRHLVEPGNWDDAWLEAESRYFAALGDRFDLVIGTSIASVGPAGR